MPTENTGSSEQSVHQQWDGGARDLCLRSAEPVSLFLRCSERSLDRRRCWAKQRRRSRLRRGGQELRLESKGRLIPFRPERWLRHAGSSPDPALIDPVLEYSHADGSPSSADSSSAAPAFRHLPASMFLAISLVPRSGGHGRLSTATSPAADPGTVDRRARSAVWTFPQRLRRDDNGEIYVLGDSNIGPSGNGGVVYKIVPIAATPQF